MQGERSVSHISVEWLEGELNIQHTVAFNLSLDQASECIWYNYCWRLHWKVWLLFLRCCRYSINHLDKWHSRVPLIWLCRFPYNEQWAQCSLFVETKSKLLITLLKMQPFNACPSQYKRCANLDCNWIIKDELTCCNLYHAVMTLTSEERSQILN